MQGRAVAGKAPACCPSLFTADAHRAVMPGCAQDAQDVPPTPSVMQRAASRGFVMLQFVRGCLREDGYGQPWTGLLNVRGHIAVVPLSPVEPHDCFCKLCQFFSIEVLPPCGPGWGTAGRSVRASRSYWAWRLSCLLAPRPIRLGCHSLGRRGIAQLCYCRCTACYMFLRPRRPQAFHRCPLSLARSDGGWLGWHTIGRCLSFSWWATAGGVGSFGVSSEQLRGCLSFVILTAAQRL